MFHGKSSHKIFTPLDKLFYLMGVYLNSYFIIADLAFFSCANFIRKLYFTLRWKGFLEGTPKALWILLSGGNIFKP